MNKKYLPIVLLPVIALAGCAFGTRHPLLDYKPLAKSAGPRNIAVYVENFKDERTEKNVIGHVRNGWGIKTADVVTDTNISEWITNALKSELGNSGYVVAKDRTDIQAGGEVLTVYCDSFMLYEGKVQIEMVLKRKDEILLNKKYLGKASNMNWAATAKSYGLTVEQSLQNVMKQVVDDINQKLSPEAAPFIGMPEVKADLSSPTMPLKEAVKVTK